VSRIYFTDRDLGKKFPQILADAGLALERHGDFFPPDGPDEQWLEYCGKNGRIAITHNQRIRYTPNELAAVIRHRVALLVVIGHAPFPELAHHFVNSIRRIETFVDVHEPPYIAKVYRATPLEIAKKPAAAGSVSLWYPA
jgi:hypothetical protein